MTSLIEDIQSLLRINTEYDEATISDTAPYGSNIAQGLAYVEKRARQDGFTTKNVDGRALAIMYGNQTDRVEATSHIDVVPAVGTWTYPPYDATLVGNRIYARGSQDMKTQIVLTYYALKKIREEHIPLKRQIRIVIGTDEEQSMQDIAYYLEKEGLPDFAFTPDSKFPICLGEKGAVTWEFNKPVTSEILSLEAGSASNVICPSVIFTTASQTIAEAFFPHEHATVRVQDDLYTVYVEGVGAHTSVPEKGRNAITDVLGVLKDVSDEFWIHELYDAFYDMYGAGIGLLPLYEPMGYASVCLNVLNLHEGNLYGSIDIRYPNPLTAADLDSRLQEIMPSFERIANFDQGPIETKLENPFVQELLGVYRSYFPEDISEPFYSGGVTYSKVYQNRCVAYGPSLSFTDQEPLAHQVDEYVLTDYLETFVDLYKDALVRIANV